MPAIHTYGWRVDENLEVTLQSGGSFFHHADYDGGSLADLITDSTERETALTAHKSALSGELSAYEAERESRNFLVCVEPLLDKRGAKAVAMDVTAYKKQEHSIGRLKQHIESILNAVGEGIYGLDREGRATFVNPAAIAMTGWSAEETIGHNIHYKHHHSYADGSPYHHTDCPIYAAINDGEVHEVDDELFWRKDGSSFPVEYTSTPIYEDGELSGAVVVFKDISERKKAEQLLLQAFSEVEALKEQLQEYNAYLQEEIRKDHNFGQIIGGSGALKQVLRLVDQVAATDATVLISGESGTGKELIARSIHDHGSRSAQAMVKINCGAIAEGVVDSELFGHEKGAFTNALETRKGRFELANGGTLFLDEVGELPLATQVKLLRVLQEQEIVRVGGSTPIRVDVRIIAATNRDLPEMVQQGVFREDLFYRLNVFPMEMPPLRERVEDVAPLAMHFLSQAVRKFGKPVQRISQSSVTLLERYSWPGNIRELQNLVERGVILAEGRVLELGGLIPQAVVKPSARVLSFKEMEIQHIEQALKVTSGVIAGPEGAAALLELHPNTLRSRMQKLGIKS